MTDWLANIRIEYIIATAAVLFAVRLVLGKYKSSLAKSAAEISESALVAIVLVFLIIRPFIVQAFYIPSSSMLPTLHIGDHILVNKFVYRFKAPEHGDIIVFRSPPQATGHHFILSLRDWNTVVGEVVSPFGDTGEVRVRADAYDQTRFEKIEEVCIVQENGDRALMGIAGLSSDNGDLVVKFSGIDNAAAAGSLAGAELRASEKDFIKRLIGLSGDVIEVKDGAVYRNGERLDESYVMDPGNINYERPPVKVGKGQLFVMGDNRNNSNDSHEWGQLDRNRVLGKAMVRFWPPNRVGLVH